MRKIYLPQVFHEIVFWKALSFLTAFSLLLFFTPVQSVAAEPLEAVRGGVEELLKILQDATLQKTTKKEERRDRIMAHIEKHFDFPRMSELVVNSEMWKGQTTADRERFVSLFSKLLEHAYVGKLENYSDQKVLYDRDMLQGDRAMVYTRILNKGQEIPMHYSMYQRGKVWSIYDVKIEGVSLIRNYRSQFATILRTDGFTVLLKKMEEKISGLDGERRKAGFKGDK